MPSPKLQERPMPRAHLRSCENCGAPHVTGMLYRVRVELGVVDKHAINARLGTAQILGGGAQAEAIAEAMTGGPVGKWAVMHEATLCITCGGDIVGRLGEPA